MQVEQFISERKERWDTLAHILDTIETGKTNRLQKEKLQHVSHFYHVAVADLARARTECPDARLIEYLNHLVARAYHLLYRKPPLTWDDVISFYHEGFPQLFRSTLKSTLLATGIFAGFTVVGYFFALGDPDFAPLLLHPELIETIERHEMWTHSINTIQPLASSAIMTNNISVSLTAFSLGVTLGIGTAYILALNGLMLGTISAMCQMHGMSLNFWSFVLPHGALELPCIVIAGAAGLLLGSSLMIAEESPRLQVLKRHGRLGILLILGTIPILVIAGIIEAFLSPKPVAPELKLGLAAIVGFLLFCYLFLAGRRANRSE